MKDKTCLPQLPKLQSYVLGLVLAVSSLCTTIRSISDLFPRRCMEEKVLGKGKGFQWFLQRVAFALFPWSFMVFPSLSSCFLQLLLCFWSRHSGTTASGVPSGLGAPGSLHCQCWLCRATTGAPCVRCTDPFDDEIQAWTWISMNLIQTCMFGCLKHLGHWWSLCLIHSTVCSVQAHMLEAVRLISADHVLPWATPTPFFCHILDTLDRRAAYDYYGSTFMRALRVIFLLSFCFCRLISTHSCQVCCSILAPLEHLPAIYIAFTIFIHI